MEQGTSREMQNGAAGHLRLSGEREETPGQEARSRKGSAVMSERDTTEKATAQYGSYETTENQAETGEEEDVGAYEEELDPRIQEELEHLNQASDEINKLELQLDAQQETQKAALRYERAVSMHTAAREMVYVAEQGLLADKNTMDPTWQEMLNHATAKVNEAEAERFHSEQEHQRVTQLCQDAEARVQTLQKALRKVILKSKPYFELKAQFNHILEEHKAKVVHLEEQVAKVKTHYSVALRNLEQISEQIHAQRGQIRASRGSPAVCGGRSSPVGAEAVIGIQISSRVGVGGVNYNWAVGEKTRLWVERHRESGWGQREHADSDCMSVISLQTITSDLEKCDSVEHLGDLSDAGSMLGEDRDHDRKPNKRPVSREIVAKGAQQERVGQEKPEMQSFVKQHHRSISL
ncbi:SH3 domain-binding protein 5-like isoform X2 [Mugil cephalus]|uniref:SH3 domain-binding protein 5-like isoform X2 n=1 Tax=Mugil cephalus TaxID=48193 RepID=UPI001FB7487A|nr:SH3 domain-binding protein 5-like isoform X2 [Mugil cephalus]